MIDKKRIHDLFVKLVEIDSPSKQENLICDFLCDYFCSINQEFSVDNAGEIIGGTTGNLHVRISGTIPGPTRLFSAHMDTVQPGERIKACLNENGNFVSRGDTILGGDDKAGIAALLEAYNYIREHKIPHPPLEFLFTVCEEQGLLGIRAFDFNKTQAKWGYVLDAGDKPGAIVVKSPAINSFEFLVKGVAAHAGINPEAGINAITVAAHALANMPNGRINEQTTCNIGMIRGGVARNIVADSCLMIGEARSLSGKELAALTTELTNSFIDAVRLKGAVPDVKVEQLYPEIELSPESEIVKHCVETIRSLDIEPFLIGTGGGSDASIINAKGIPCLNLGVGMNEVHTTKESISLKSLIDTTRIVVSLMRYELNH